MPSRPLLGAVAATLGLAALIVSSLCGRRRAARFATHHPEADVSDLWPVAGITLIVAIGATLIVAIA